MKFLKQKAGFGTGTLVGLLIVAVLAGALVPVAVASIVEASGNFTGGASSLWILLPIIIVIAVALGFLKIAGVGMK
jgi:uncharacterized RDD family membrane protein YckC